MVRVSAFFRGLVGVIHLLPLSCPGFFLFFLQLIEEDLSRRMKTTPEEMREYHIETHWRLVNRTKTSQLAIKGNNAVHSLAKTTLFFFSTRSQLGLDSTGVAISFSGPPSSDKVYQRITKEFPSIFSMLFIILATSIPRFSLSPPRH